MLNWDAFNSLPGSTDQNFENLCRNIVRMQFGQFGSFTAYKQQPGIEFYLHLNQNCALGSSGRCYGWQCKYHTRTKSNELTAASRKDIEDSLRKSETAYPNLTDWILWTPFTLSRKDQEWFNSLTSKFTLHLWTETEVDAYAAGPALLFRSTYFGELILTPDDLKQRQWESVQPIRERWFDPAHQEVDAERRLRRMLGEPGSWDHLIAVGKQLEKAAETFRENPPVLPATVVPDFESFKTSCKSFADTLLEFHEVLAEGDLDAIQQRLQARRALIGNDTRRIPRLLRTFRSPLALIATNALDDMKVAQSLLDEVEEFLGVGVVAVMADAGGGKTQIAVQLTIPQQTRPAGILLLGRWLKRGQTLDDLSHRFLINSHPAQSMESLIAALDAAGKRSQCRLPIVIDGLNEAENPRDWKDALATVAETVKRYPNVLVILTLRTGEFPREAQNKWREDRGITRESFAIMALPDTIRRIESSGFGADANDAIWKYFTYFKINPGDAEIPIEFLQHPLTLRIYCENTNPKHERVVHVNYFPASLAPLFEIYIANICDRISRISFPNRTYDFAEIEAAIYKLGIEIWKCKSREISESNYKVVISDSDQWDSSLVNLLVQEGIIFRNPGNEPGEYFITPAYDALGGYIAANSVMRKYESSNNFPWTKESNALKLFTGSKSHELANDILRSLVWLFPRRLHGRQLWKESPTSLSDRALSLTFELDPQYLDEGTISELLRRFRENPTDRRQYFGRFWRTRGCVNHPLNAEFLDNCLRGLPVSDRDLSWTEWIRRWKQDIQKDVLYTEQNWRRYLDQRTEVDRLRAKWIMWLLTSTDHELRDLATRAIYWYGRGDPEILFDECLRSLEINDPYVPERMLAASYGISMALHLDSNNREFIDNILPKFAFQLYVKMFAEDALHSTSHMHRREYAVRIIELALFHLPDFLTIEQKRRCRPPFKDSELQVWGESEITVEEHHGADSPFRMDFENYMIGGLVPNRRNYDYSNLGFKKIRSQILWRVNQLGWRKEHFGDIDRSISQGELRPRTESAAWRIDRYGKKYSLIAYYEMAGHLQDQGLLEDWHERSLSIDIEISFPENITKERLIDIDFLGDPEAKTTEWIANGHAPDLTPYLRMAEIKDITGPWLALDGFVIQQDEDRGRQSFCFIRSLLVAKQDVSSVLDHLRNQDLGGRWLPAKPEFSYTLNGEIPWSETFPESEPQELSFIIKEEKVKVQRTQTEIYKDGKEVVDWRIFSLLSEIDKDTGKGTLALSDSQLDGIEIKDVLVEFEEIQHERVNFKVIIPVCDISWQGHDSAACKNIHARTLPKEIALELGLVGKSQTFDLFAVEGSQATLNVSDRSEDFNNKQNLFFIRENTLKDYLANNNLVLIWAIWGEREFSNDQIERMRRSNEQIEQGYAVYKILCYYDAETSFVNPVYCQNNETDPSGDS